MQVPGRDTALPADREWRDSRRLDVEFSRLLCVNGHSASCRDGTRKTWDSRGVDGRTAVGPDAASRIRHGDDATRSNFMRRDSQ